MKKTTKTLTMIMILVLSLSAISFADSSYGHYAVGESELTLENMLIYAIQDEYLARGEYALIMEAYGNARPFTNIIRAEGTHITALETIFNNYNINIPIDESRDHIVLPDSLRLSYEIGVQAEIDNIDMYNTFLNEELPSDVRAVFEALKRASESHLRAFTRQTSK